MAFNLEKNPIMPAISDMIENLGGLEFKTSNADFFSNLIAAPLMALILCFLHALIPLGFIFQMNQFFWKYVPETRDKMKEKSAIEAMPYMFILGFYIAMWLPFAILSLPSYLLGQAGIFLAKLCKKRKSDKNIENRSDISRP